MKSWKKIMVISATFLMIATIIISQYLIFSIDTVVVERFTIEYSDELRDDEWEAFRDFPREDDIKTIDLTYGTFHEYIRVSHQGENTVHMNVTFEADTRYENDKNYIGFVILDGIVGPRDISWNQTSAIHNDQDGEIHWGFQHRNIVIPPGETRNYTIINVLNKSAPSQRIYERMWIRWHFESDEVMVSHPMELELLSEPWERVSRFTHLTFTASIIATAVIGYVLFKGKGVL